MTYKNYCNHPNSVKDDEWTLAGRSQRLDTTHIGLGRRTVHVGNVDGPVGEYNWSESLLILETSNVKGPVGEDNYPQMVIFGQNRRRILVFLPLA